MGTHTRHNRRVERYLQQINSSRDQKLPTSWNDFLDTVVIGSGHISNAGVYSTEGQRWASIGLEMSKEEVVKLVKAFIDPTNIYRDGIYIDNKKYCCLSAHSHVIVGRNSEQTVTISRCKTCVLVGVHQHKANSNSAHTVMIKLANYLTEQKL